MKDKIDLITYPIIISSIGCITSKISFGTEKFRVLKRVERLQFVFLILLYSFLIVEKVQTKMENKQQSDLLAMATKPEKAHFIYNFISR